MLTDAKRAEIISNVLPMTLQRKISLMLDTDMWVLLLLLVVPVPARAMGVAEGEGLKILQ